MASRGWEHVTESDAARMGRKPIQVKPSKYHAVKTTIDGVTFDSKKEAKRYLELKALQASGEIHLLELQPEFLLVVPSSKSLGPVVLLGEYRGDFRYCECSGGRNNCGWCAVVVEDVKGFKTPLYRWKKKHVEAQYGITIREI